MSEWTVKREGQKSDLSTTVKPCTDRLDRALKRPSRLDTVTLTLFEAHARNSWQLIPDVAGTASRNSLSYLLEHLQSVIELLEVSQPTSIHRRLCSIASELALATGVMLTSMRDFANAQTYYRLSIEAARESAHHPLEAVGLARSSLALIYDDQAPVALPYVQEARRLAHQSATTTTRAWLAAVEAEVQANMNKLDACTRSLEQAEIVTDRALQPEEDPYKTTFSRPLLAGYKGVCYLRLKKPDMAQVILQEALAQPNSPSIYLQSSMLTDLATTYTQQGEIEEACRVATQAVTMTIYTRIPSMRQYLWDFRQQLERWEHTQAVKDLDKQLRLLRHSTVPLGL